MALVKLPPIPSRGRKPTGRVRKPNSTQRKHSSAPENPKFPKNPAHKANHSNVQDENGKWIKIKGNEVTKDFDSLENASPIERKMAIEVGSTLYKQMPLWVQPGEHVVNHLMCSVEKWDDGADHVETGFSPHDDIVLCPYHLERHFMTCRRVVCQVFKARGMSVLMQELRILQVNTRTRRMKVIKDDNETD